MANGRRPHGRSQGDRTGGTPSTMRAPVKLALYLAGLVVVFACSYAVAAAVVPQGAVRDWMDEDAPAHPSGPADPGAEPDGDQDHSPARPHPAGEDDHDEH